MCVCVDYCWVSLYVHVHMCVCVSLRVRECLGVSGCKRTGQLRLSMSLKNVIIHFCVKISNKRRENEKVWNSSSNINLLTFLEKTLFKSFLSLFDKNQLRKHSWSRSMLSQSKSQSFKTRSRFFKSQPIATRSPLSTSLQALSCMVLTHSGNWQIIISVTLLTLSGLTDPFFANSGVDRKCHNFYRMSIDNRTSIGWSQYLRLLSSAYSRTSWLPSVIWSLLGWLQVELGGVLR